MKTIEPTRRRLLVALASLGAFAPLAAAAGTSWVRPESFWRKRLSPERFQILREQGTESPGSSPLDEERRPGIYACAGCDLHLYSSKTKFDSGTGWPSFYAPLRGAVTTATDTSLGMTRDEVRCVRCQGHLGHVFPDGPKPTGLRYCMNGLALRFYPGAA